MSLAEAIEQIDIGGPSMIRSAAKNHACVGVVVDPDDYPAVLAELRGRSGASRRDARGARAQGVRAHGALRRRDPRPSRGAGGRGARRLPARLRVDLERSQLLRYGENPHQRAALYGRFLEVAEPLHGKELSYNNLIDVQAALALILDFPHEEGAAVAILKHNTPCGVGLAATPLEAWQRAFATDPESPFGGIIVANRAFDLALARAVDEIFTEVLIAPGFAHDALALLQQQEEPAPAALPPRAHRPQRARRAARLRRRCSCRSRIIALEDVAASPG